MLVIALIASTPAAVPTATAATPSETFPVGWYDGLVAQRLHAIAREGMTAVLPYGVPGRDPRAYLDAARSNRLTVFVELDRRAVASGNVAAVVRFVDAYKRHPAVHAWYLADEPMLQSPYISPAAAEKVYLAVKARDPSHPVSIAFGIKEDAGRYREAMDVLMYDDYPITAGRKEFVGLPSWWERLRHRAKIAWDEDGFLPILQAFGEDERGIPQFTKRLPTLREMRYMAYASLQAGGTGLFFWVRYRSRPSWTRSVLVPLVRELRRIGRARGDGGLRQLATSHPGDVIVTSLHDASTGDPIVVAINHSDKPIDASFDVAGQTVGERFGPYEVRVYER